MANESITLELDVQKTLSATDKVAGVLGGLHTVLEKLGVKMRSILAGADIITFLGDAATASGKCRKELLVMQLALGKLRVAWGNAFAPIAQAVLPMVNDAIFAAIRFVKYIGEIIAALFGMKSGAYGAAAAQNTLEKSANAASKALKRSLAGFDQINRLNGSGGYSSGGGVSLQSPELKLDETQTAIVGKLLALLQPLKQIDLQPLINGLGRLWNAMQPITRQLFAGLEWAWYNIFVPIAQWTAEKLLSAFLDTLALVMEALAEAIEACKPAFSWVWENFLKPMAQWTGNALLEGLRWLRTRLGDVSAWMQENKVPVEKFLLIVGAISAAIVVLNTVVGALQVPFGLVIGLVALLATRFLDMEGIFDSLPASAKEAWQKIKGVLEIIWGWVKKNVLDPVLAGMKGTINGIIAYLNSCILAVVKSVNSVVATINQLSFQVPDWVPELGGKRFGFNLKKAKATPIPYLAQGAVLPANKPFLAVVGDQRHGTNIEAPLTTIQEAVALVMEDMIASSLAGQEAVVGVLRQILEAVLGIHIGDGDVARAVDRYRRSMAVVRGI